MRARRLACRCWAGRVALRENRAPTHRLTAPRRSEAGAPQCLACVLPAPGPAWLGDSTLVAWYRSLYAPRTGGAYDSQNRTAGIAGCTRRRGGGVAADGACAEPAMPVVGFAFALGRALDSISALSARTRELGNSNGYPQKFASCLFSTNFARTIRQCRMVAECENVQDHCPIPARWERDNTGAPAC